MDESFWETVWTEGRTGFDQADVNRHLVKHLPVLVDKQTSARVLVPLCGKSTDMTYIEKHGHRVVGVELVELAARSYFEGLGLSPCSRPIDGLFALEAETTRVTILVGDMLSVTPSMVSQLDCIYDRAALIALPEPVRPLYSRKLIELATAGTRMLLLTVFYDQSKVDGPPFSVPPDEVERLFGEACDVECIWQETTSKVPERMQELGVEEGTWLLTFKG